MSRGDMQAAINILRGTLPEVEQLHGSDSLETAQNLFTLALCIFQADRSLSSLEEAACLGRRALDVRIKLKGTVDASVAITSDFLSSVYKLLGKTEDAEFFCRLSLENAERLVGAQHINTAKAQYGLAQILITSKTKLEEATELLSKCVDSRRRVFGPNNEETVSAITALANVWDLRGDAEKAKAFLIEAENLDKLVDRTIIAPNQQSMRI